MMKRNALIIGVVLSLLMTACGAQATATVSPADVQHTAEAAAFTMVAQTQQSLPTDTPVPPTDTASPTLPVTNTPLPTLISATLNATNTTPVAVTVTSQPNIPTFTPQPQSTAGTTNCNKLLTAWDGPTTRISVTDETTPAKAFVIISFTVTTPLGECGYIGTSFTGSGSLSGPYGFYTAVASVNGKKNFIVASDKTFEVKQGSVNVVVRNNNIVMQGGCYPNC
jgi:hypothetical protein